MLDYEFMRNAFAAAAIVAVLSASVGYFLVLRGQTFAGHALSHIGFTGATGAALIGLTPFGGMLFAALIGGLGIGVMGERLAQRDIAVGIVLSLSLGLGLLFLHFYTSYATQATALLFGNVLAIDKSTVHDLLWMGLIGLVVLAVLSRPLLFASLQPELAQARGVPVRSHAMLFMVLAAMATALCAQVVGILLVFTLMVGPPAAAQRLTGHLGKGVALAIVLALLSGWLGIVLAYYTDWPCSFWITFISCLCYGLSVLIGLGRNWRQARSRTAHSQASAAH